jgi:SAM-dependent methyltransferase
MRLTGFRRTGVFRLLSRIAHAFLPWQLVERLREKVQGTRYEPPVGRVQFGSFRRLTPISRTWGYDRGGSIARYYIERFLAQHHEDIRGRVLEITNSRYTQQFGDDRVTQSDVLDLTSENPNATIVADLTHGEGVPSGVFDCIILTQTLHVIEDSQAAIHTLHRILKPGGVVLATLPGISPIRPSDWGGYWCGSYLSARSMFAKVFSAPNVRVQTHGNVLAAIAYLEGLGATELHPSELDYHDPDFEVTITVRAVKTNL